MSAFQEFQMEQTWKLRVLEAKGLANEFQQTKWEQQVGKYWDLIIILYMQYMNIYIYTLVGGFNHLEKYESM